MQNVFHFCLTVVPMMFSLSVFNVITDSMLTKSVPSSETGKIKVIFYTQDTIATILSKSSKQHSSVLLFIETALLLHTGTMLGLCSSVQSLLRTVGPTAGGFLYVNYGISSIGIVQFLVNTAVFVYLFQRSHSKTAEQKP